MLKSTRSGFGDAITKLGETNPKVVVVSANLASSLKVTNFAEEHPKRFFECGVAENNMMAVAAGLALSGKIPFACSFAAFSPYINWSVIRQSVCLNKANVKIASSHAGLLTGADGATHQALEDLALMQVLPNITVVVPADYEEAYQATLASAKINGPVYLRLTRPDTPLIQNAKKEIPSECKMQKSDFCEMDNVKFKIGEAQVLKKGKKLTIITCGPIIFEAIEAMKQLNNLDIELINCHTLKPLDKETILASVKKTGRCLTLEDHQVFGGLGTAVARLLAENYPVPIKMLAVKNQFGESAKQEKELLEKFCLDAASIVKTLLLWRSWPKSNQA